MSATAHTGTAQPTLSGQVALITGAGRGIGRAIALRLARADIALVLAARTESQLVETARLARQLGVEALPLPTDLTRDEQTEALVATALERFGHLDIVVNNAGGGPPRTPVVKARPADWDATLRTNLWATMLVSKLVLPAMLAQGRGDDHQYLLTGRAGRPGRRGRRTRRPSSGSGASVRPCSKRCGKKASRFRRSIPAMSIPR